MSEATDYLAYAYLLVHGDDGPLPPYVAGSIALFDWRRERGLA